MHRRHFKLPSRSRFLRQILFLFSRLLSHQHYNYLLRRTWFRPAMVQQYSSNVQAELHRDLLLEAGYVGTRGTHLVRQRSLNQALSASPTVQSEGSPRIRSQIFRCAFLFPEYLQTPSR